MMWEKTSAVMTPTGTAEDRAGASPLLDRLSSRDLARLTMGFYFAFWGTALLLGAFCEMLTSLRPKVLDIIMLGLGCAGLVMGAVRFHQVTGLGDSWRRRTREALIGASLLTYLCPFFLMWQRMSSNLYLLGHAIAFVAIFNYWLALSCQVICQLGHASGKRSLVLQSILFGSITVLLLFPPFGRLALEMIVAARHGMDPVGLLQMWIARASGWLVFALLLPFPLTLSLLWSAKDEALRRLLNVPEN